MRSGWVVWLVSWCLVASACTNYKPVSQDGRSTATPGGGSVIAHASPLPTPLPTKTPRVDSLAKPQLEDIKVGEGKSVEEVGAIETTIKVWEGKFNGKPFGKGKITLVLPVEDCPIPALLDLHKGMRKGGIRHVKVAAGKVFKPDTLRVARVAADKTLYMELSLDKVFPKQPLGIKTVKPGQGKRVTKKGDRIRVDYTGWLKGFAKGKPFDSSAKRGPMVFVLGEGQVIPGWDKGLLGMKVGEVRRLKVPHYLAYGNRNLGVIPPYSTLYFQVKLLGFVEPGKLKVQTVKPGKGRAAKSGDRVKVQYTGWLDGFGGKKMFDSSRKPGRKPFVFELGRGQVISGWDQGVEGMKPGEIRRLTIPYNLAYGERGSPPTIPPFSTLYFEVEYLGLAAPEHATSTVKQSPSPTPHP